MNSFENHYRGKNKGDNFLIKMNIDHKDFGDYIYDEINVNWFLHQFITFILMMMMIYVDNDNINNGNNSSDDVIYSGLILMISFMTW
jgi:hypothetical protein